MYSDTTTSSYNADTGEAEIFSSYARGVSYKFHAETFSGYSETCRVIRQFEKAAYSDAVGDVLNHVSNFRNR